MQFGNSFDFSFVFQYFRWPHSNGSFPEYWEMKFCSPLMLLEREELHMNLENLQDSGSSI